ncbi:MAG: Flp pilus assembly complex ATPase component TadA [Acidobacteriia bacterium]|nr:Flp pilus assembly complex ATPase component TadA [Terriglobia bacterium]
MLNFDLPGFLGAIVSAAPGAGDVLLAVGLPPQVRIEGEFKRLEIAGLQRLTPFQTEAVVVHLLAQAPASAAARVRQEGAAHFAYSSPGISRFRVAVFTQRGTFAVSLRTIPEGIPLLGDLGLPAAMREACQERHGIVLVNGPAGSGRSTSLAAMLGEVNSTRSCHVVTVEDPIEFLHRHATATINQREVGTDTPTLAAGLASALRQGAQVLLVTEPTDGEGARLLLEAAETGHLVLTTLRGLDTASSLMRMLSLFPPEERGEVRSRLARVLRWSFTQQLVPQRDGRRPVVEIWRATRATTAHLADGPLSSSALADLLRDGERDGLLGFDRALERAVRAGEVEIDTAMAHAVLPRQLELRLVDLREAHS